MKLVFFLFFFQFNPLYFSFLLLFYLNSSFFSQFLPQFFLIIVELSLDLPSQLDHVKITLTRFNFKHGLNKESGQDYFSFQFHRCFLKFFLILCNILSGLSLE